MFLGREDEKKAVADFLNQAESTVLSVYGRRRVGKTSLVLECLKEAGGNIINYTCEKGKYANNLSKFIARVKEVLGVDAFPDYSSFRGVFEYLRNVYQNRRFVIFLDEFPYIWNENPSDPSISEFQAIVDESKGGNLKFIFCGSSIHFMNVAFSDYANPLYGRSDKFLELRPFSFLETKRFFPNRDFRDLFLAYGISGGIPAYLAILLSHENVHKALEEECFSFNGYFFREGGFSLKSEFEDTSAIERILSYIGLRERNTSDIAKHSGINVNGINYHLNKLKVARLIKPVENAFAGNSKESKWTISDPFFCFYYTYIAPNRDLIALSDKASFDLIFNAEEETLFLSRVYELIAPELVVHYALKGKIPFIPKTYRKWRAIYKEEGGALRENEMDGAYYDEKNVVFLECKYRNKVVGESVLSELKEKAAHLNSGERKPYYLLMSLKGFTPELIGDKQSDVFLIQEDRLLEL